MMEFRGKKETENSERKGNKMWNLLFNRLLLVSSERGTDNTDWLKVIIISLR